MTTTCILINQITYNIPNIKPLFQDLSLSFSEEKTGIVGKNGTGKSTLLKLIIGDLIPELGSININGTLAYCPQDLNFLIDETIAKALGVEEKIQALQRITQGSIDEKDYTLLGDDWHIQEKISQQLDAFDLAYLSLDQQIKTLSGGERTRLMLAKAFLAAPDFIICDEPTNNLDLASRQFLYQAIRSWDKGLIVVSHDRQLLNLMDQIIEFNTLGIDCYGGNYDHYNEQKKLNQAALGQEILDAQKSLSLTKQSIQCSYEKREQKQSKGRKLFLTGKIDRITANSKKGRSEKTEGKNARNADSMGKSAEEKLAQAKSKMEITYIIDVSLPKTQVAKDKILINLEDVSYSYAKEAPPIINNFSCKIVGPERVSLLGTNGSGKTTLVKLIQGKLQPDKGLIERGTTYINYLDQHAEALDPESSILDNFVRLNPGISDNDARHNLARFLFRNVSATKLVKYLSGGEKLRALLACILMSEHPPQLLILDEPTNHLDFDSITSIETALSQYQGGLIVISHDQVFLENIGVTKAITSPFVVN
ncbi:MAG: ABC-F family ATP-binding cassette domain-containing protein [Tatlockia sp.]|nr:ABC-F family ATP-binding cassette domain-containing protein [Tatlockia sp.]